MACTSALEAPCTLGAARAGQANVSAASAPPAGQGGGWRGNCRIRFNCVVRWLRGAAHKETWAGRCVLTAAFLIADVPERLVPPPR